MNEIDPSGNSGVWGDILAIGKFIRDGFTRPTTSMTSIHDADEQAAYAQLDGGSYTATYNAYMAHSFAVQKTSMLWGNSGEDAVGCFALPWTNEVQPTTVLDVLDGAGTIEEYLAGRSLSVHSGLDDIASIQRTTAAMRAVDTEGNSFDLFASSTKSLTVDQKLALREGEIPVTGAGHAEETLFAAAKARNLEPRAIGITRAPCIKTCVPLIGRSGIPWRVKFP